MQIIGHMCAGWTGAIIMFLAGIDATDNKDACTAIAVLLHYFLLVVFMWSFLQAAYLYMVLVRVYAQQAKMLVIKMAFVAWGEFVWYVFEVS